MKKRLLLIANEFFVPPVGGGHLRTLQIVRAVSELFDVHVVSYVLPDQPVQEMGLRELGGVCREVTLLPLPVESGVGKVLRYLHSFLRGQNPAAQKYLRWSDVSGISRVIESVAPDVIVFEHSFLAPLRSRLEIGKAVTVLDAHNYETELQEQLYRSASTMAQRLRYFINWRTMGKLERAMVPRFDVLWATSPVDREKFRRIGGQVDVRVVPNTVDFDVFANYMPPPEEPGTLLFSGSFDYAPNVYGARFFVESILPELVKRMPQVRLYLVGKEPPPEILRLNKDPHIVVTGRVQDVRPYLGRASLVVVPLYQGSGTRLKILEAMAMGKAVISTSVGSEGLEVTHGVDIWVADTVEAFTDGICHLLADTQLRQALGKAGRELVRERYSLDAVRPETRHLLFKVRGREDKVVECG